ncbi:RHS and YD repeat-containing protein [Candidatus Electronema halotolerans]
MRASHYLSASLLLLAVFFLFTSAASAYQCDEREPLYANWEVPASGPGPNFTQVWGLVNNTGCPIKGFTLSNPDVYQWTGFSYVPYAGTVSGSYSTFSLAPDGGPGQVTANFNFTLPPEGGVFFIFFDIITDDGSVLPYLSGGSYPGYKRLYAVVGGGAGGACLFPPPAISYVDHVDLGNGEVAVKADVENAGDDPTLEVNDSESEMKTGSGGYTGSDSTGMKTDSSNTIEVKGLCPGMSASMEYNYFSPGSAWWGQSLKCGNCGGSQRHTGDPVNTAIGNFVYDETDGSVAGPGNSTIRLARAYNSLAALRSPATLTRHYPDGKVKIKAQPPQYFGKGWTSELGQYLLKIDMKPAFQGVQVLYADGHTANFKKSGSSYVSDSPGTHDVVTKEGGEYVLRPADCGCSSSEEKRFDSKGHLTALTDRNGNQIRLIYADGKLAAVENSGGRRVEFTLNDDGQIIEARLPEDITLRYEYEDGLLAAFVDGKGNRTAYHYDDHGQMTEIISAKGHPVVRNSYDEEYRVSSQIVGESAEQSFSYENGKTTVTDAYGNAEVHHYDADLRLIRLEHRDGTVEQFEYDNDLNRTGYTDQSGAEWHWTFDKNGNRLTADGPLGWHRAWEYNERNQVTKMTEKVDEATERASTFTYDDRGNLTEFCNALNACGAVTYDDRGLPVQMTDLNGNVSNRSYDAAGDLVMVTDAENAVTALEHDGLGRLKTMTKPLGGQYRYAYDKAGNLTAVDGPIGFHLEFSYNANNLPESKVDPNGGEVRLTHNASDKPELIVNQLGFEAARFEYGLMAEKTGFTDAEGRKWEYVHDSMLRLAKVSGPLDAEFSYQRDEHGRITDFTDANGTVTHTEYDALGRPVSVTRNWRPGFAASADTNVTTRYEYNLVGDLLAKTDPAGNVFSYSYDLQSRRIASRDPEGYEWQFSYDPMGNLLQALNPRGYSTALSWTPTARLKSVTDPEGHAVSYGHDTDGNLISKTSALGIVTRYEYDALDRRAAMIRNYDPAQAADQQSNVTVEYGYDLAGNLTSLTDPLGHQASFAYDAAHRRVEAVDFEDGTTSYAYDKVDNLISRTDAEGNATQYIYDDLDRKISRTNAEDETIGYVYDLMGNKVQLVEADGGVTRYGHDGLYRLNQVIQNWRPGAAPADDVNAVTRYAYDARGLLLEIVNANNAATRFSYDKVGNLLQETDPLGKTWQYAYDGMGNRISRKDGNNALTEYAFFPDDLLQRIAYADGSAVSYAYDADNRRTLMKDWLGETNWQYDPLGRVTGTTDPLGSALAFAYDADSNRTALRYPDGSLVEYAYSPNNWLQMMTVGTIHELSQQTEYSRNKVGSVTKIVNANTTETEIEYDRVYRTLSRATAAKGKNIVAFAYTYNELGHVIEASKRYGWRNPEEQQESYAYDGLRRLAEVSISPLKNNGNTATMRYAYDPVGNRLSWQTDDDLSTAQPGDGFSRTYAYNAANQLLRAETNSMTANPNRSIIQEYRYDSNGSRIGRTERDSNGPVYGTDYSFDPENRLIRALDYQLAGKGGKNRINRAVTLLDYDGGGRRLAQSYDPKAGKGGLKRVEYAFDGLDPVAEYNQLNGQYDNYYRGTDNEISVSQHFNSGAAGQLHWYHYNRKGDVAGLTKQNGNAAHTYRYEPYGAVIPENGNFTDPHNHYTLTGKEFDENTGLVWFGARHYEPETGVWMGQDVYRGRLDEPGSLHRFGYVENNPVNYIDKNGYFIDTLWDAANVGVDLARIAWSTGELIAANMNDDECLKKDALNGLKSAGFDLGLDLIATAIPFVPAGLNKVGKGIKSYKYVSSAIDDYKYGKYILKGGEYLYDGIDESAREIIRQIKDDEKINISKSKALNEGFNILDLSEELIMSPFKRIIKKQLFPRGDVGRPPVNWKSKLFGVKSLKNNYFKFIDDFDSGFYENVDDFLENAGKFTTGKSCMPYPIKPDESFRPDNDLNDFIGGAAIGAW